MLARKSALLLGILLLSSPLLAGCLNVSNPLQSQSAGEGRAASVTPHPQVAFTTPGALPLPNVTGPLASTAPALFSVGQDAGEPTLGVTSDGSLYYVASTFNNSYTANELSLDHVLKSTDQGATWSDVTPATPGGVPTAPASLDPYLYVDTATDRVYRASLYVGCANLAWSDDGGRTWTTNPVACGVPVNDHETIGAGPSAIGTPTVGYPDILYYCVNQVADTICSRSLDGGYTFSPGVPVFPGVSANALDVNDTSPDGLATSALNAFCGGLQGHVHVGPQGTVYMPRGFCGTPYVGVSHDDGLTWQDVQVDTTGVGMSGHDGSVATDAAGNAYYFWIGADGLPYLSVSSDLGENWSAPMMVGAPNVTTAAMPQVTASAEGKVAFVYLGTTSQEGGINANDSEMPDATWNGYIGVIPNALSANPTVVSSIVNDPSNPLVRGACPGSTRCHGMYDFLDIVIDHQGRPWASFVDTCTSAKCTGPQGTPADSDGNLGLVGTLASGEALTAQGGALPQLGSLGSTYQR